MKKLLIWLILTGIILALSWAIYQRLLDTTSSAMVRKSNKDRAVPVEVASIERGSIELQRVFTGTLEARAEFVVAPKVGGRVEQLDVDVADHVTRGQTVAKLDDAEYVQAVAQAQADLEVARANLAEARSLLQIAERELQRIEELGRRGVSSESQSDTARAEQLARQAHVEVTRAQVTRAQAELETARIRLGYSAVQASWSGGENVRVVAERYIDEGETVSANTPLLRIVELDPLSAVFFVTERDYARLQPGQHAKLTTDAFPDENFPAVIERIAPVFRAETRQARVELNAANPNLHLKPGMFVRATIVLEQLDDATIVPAAALSKRDERQGVFVVEEGHAFWHEVVVGIRQAERVQIQDTEINGQVVTLGQQLLDDGSAVLLVNANQ